MWEVELFDMWESVGRGVTYVLGGRAGRSEARSGASDERCGQEDLSVLRSRVPEGVGLQ